MTMYHYDYATLRPEQVRVLESTPHLFLDQRDQLNFHFMMHMRLKLKSPDFMSSFERDLLARKFDALRTGYQDFREDDYRHSFIPLRTHDFSDIGPEQFQALLNDNTNTPILAKGLARDAHAVREWSHRHLIDNYGDVEIMAFDYYAKNADIFRKLKLGEILRSQLDTNARRRYYINNSAEIFNDYPHLIDEVGADRIIELFRGHSINTFSQLFAGNLATWGTNWHQGNDLSCAIMVNGSKRWYFMDPRLSYVLRPTMNGANGIVSTLDGRFDLDYHRVHEPLYAAAPKFYVDMEPGDVLFFTKFWPHAVFNTSPLQIMVNMRMTEIDLETMTKGSAVASLLPIYENILDSDADFIKFKFEIFKNLGRKEKMIGDRTYFSAVSTSGDSASMQVSTETSS
jgi:hypothetical protein